MMRLLTLILAWSFLPGFGVSAQVIISEFMAKNATSIVDEDDSPEDWIEIYNASTNTVDLFNWSLTDNPGNLTKWRFPSTFYQPSSAVGITGIGASRPDARDGVRADLPATGAGRLVRVSDDSHHEHAADDKCGGEISRADQRGAGSLLDRSVLGRF